LIKYNKHIFHIEAGLSNTLNHTVIDYGYSISDSHKPCWCWYW